MEKHILLTVGDDTSASVNLRFVREFFLDYTDFRVTLFYVAPHNPSCDVADLRVNPGPSLCVRMKQQAMDAGKRALGKARRRLLDMGLADDHVDEKITVSLTGTVGEIIKEARDGLYDAVLLGRSSMNWVDNLVEGGVSHRMLWEEIDFPIWLCGSTPAKESRDVLLCVDDSGPSQRIADHVGFILGGSTDHRVTLFHVKPHSAHVTGDDIQILEQAREQLRENGFSDHLVDIKIAMADDVCNALIEEAVSRNYAVVAVGRHHGRPPSAMKRLFPDSLTTRLLRTLDCPAVWISK